MLDSWLDLVHGTVCVGCPAPGRSLCAQCTDRLPTRGVSVRPTPCPPGLAGCFAAGEYADLLRAMILAHKEHGAFSLAGPLGHVLAVAAMPAVDPDAVNILVPVPSRGVVVRERGHDPVLRMVRAAARRLRRSGLDARVGRLLEQRAQVSDQAGLSAEQRRSNLAGSMQVRPRARVGLGRTGAPVAILVCDDVLTTGATAREAQRALEVSGLPTRAVVTVAATRRRLPSRAGPQGVPPVWALPFSGRAV